MFRRLFGKDKRKKRSSPSQSGVGVGGGVNDGLMIGSTTSTNPRYQYALNEYAQTIPPAMSNDDGRNFVSLYPEDDGTTNSHGIAASIPHRPTNNDEEQQDGGGGGGNGSSIMRSMSAEQTATNDSAATGQAAHLYEQQQQQLHQQLQHQQQGQLPPLQMQQSFETQQQHHQQQQHSQPSQQQQQQQQQQPHHISGIPSVPSYASSSSLPGISMRYSYSEVGPLDLPVYPPYSRSAKLSHRTPFLDSTMPDATYEEVYGEAYVGGPIKYLYPSGYQSMRPRGGPWKLSIVICLSFTWLSIFIIGHCSDRIDQTIYQNEIDDDTLEMEIKWCGSRPLYSMWVVSMLITGLATAYCSVIGYIKVRDFSVANSRSQPPGVVGKSDYYIKIDDHGMTISDSDSMVSGRSSTTTSTTYNYKPTIYQSDGRPQFWGGHIYKPTQAAVAITSR